MNRKESYADVDKWRATCSKQKKRYYGRTQLYAPREWTQEETDLVLARDMTDMELSKLIHRSVQAIQVKRSRLNSK